ncbi:pyruvate formate lyase activating enzyme [Thermanaeromonas toyohensis ToBE]|uniref:Pyruvate formate lyase activating enzyme n=1 Tax=Thermanaeromonas toyohensis ToBE TaxID=698762 RepID=A0A1W1W1V0_9FIRM|nr:radical SAM protein [Thermanaeromonas toyohensis]SMB99577.1 pyruvate formate lyase activating enzyme [Thermanaeromonas toyohensis ToBE]
MRRKKWVECRHCNSGRPAARVLRYLCGECLKQNPHLGEEVAEAAHRRSRIFPPFSPPRTPGGITCLLCGNRCQLGEGQEGFCRLRYSRDGKLISRAGTARFGLGSFYFDPLPTNCVAGWVCPGGTGAGYPKYAYRPGPEVGYQNLAVFLGACSFDCLYCQNSTYREMAGKGEPLLTLDDLVNSLDERTACICFFGGDPSPQMPFTLAVARRALKKAEDRIMRVCWETNGNLHPRYLEPMVELALASGGVIKFDLKAWDDDLHRFLTGVSNRQTLANFRYLSRYFDQRPDPPLLVASTLLVPGYVGRREVAGIARFLANLNSSIPYTLLAFAPTHLLDDLPLVTREEAEDCYYAAREAGLTRVRLANLHLLR